MSTSLLIVGDVVPQSVSTDFFYTHKERIFSEMRPYIAGTDFSVANLEAPVIYGKPSPIRKSGPCLSTSPLTVKALKDVGFGMVTLANNHFFDQGQIGVENTIRECNRMNIRTMGGGVTARQAREPLLIEHNGKQIAIINACENEFSVADSDHGGSNSLDLINMQEDIKRVRNEVDYIILILHGGVEQYQYPTPRMKRWYRHFVDLGADAVINHHQHCICGYELYKDKPIFYGLGNFYFPKLNSNATTGIWDYGYAVSLTLADKIGFELIPYRQDINGISLRDIKEFSMEIELLNLPIADDYLLQQKFDEHLIDTEYYLKSQLLPSFLKGRFFSAITSKGFMGKTYKGDQLYNIMNKLTCESHRESLQRLFTILTKH